MKNVNFLCCVILLFGCVPQNESPKYIDDNDLIPPEPTFLSYFTIHGEDVDQDGVRDDYELYVNRRFKDPNLRRAIKYQAKILGEFMRATDVSEINRLHKEDINASICKSVLIPVEMDAMKDNLLEVNDMFLNNPWRRMHFNKQGEMVQPGTYSWGNSSIISSLKRCRIEFKDLGKTLQIYVPNGRYKYGMNIEEIEEFEEIVGIKNDKK